MQIVASVDIEDALRVDLSALYAAAGIDGVSFSAMPIPPSLGDLPAAGTMVCIRRVGGSRSDLVEDVHAVSMDVYASTWGEAIAEANRLVGMCLAMPYERGLSLHYHAAAITSQPVELPDTSNPVMPRVRCSMQFSVRGDVMMTS
jgi:hypothetical protein